MTFLQKTHCPLSSKQTKVQHEPRSLGIEAASTTNIKQPKNKH